MKDLIIVGAGGFGREVLQWTEDINKEEPTWNILGFIDDNPDALKGCRCDYGILGSVAEWKPEPTQYFACALAFPDVKYKVVNLLKSRGAKFATIIHPTALVNKYAEIGEGVIMTPRSHVTADVKIGDFVSILGSSIGHDAVVGSYSTLSGRCSVNGRAVLGERVYMGCGAMIAPSKKIGDGAKIGMGSVVISNVKAGTEVFGNPARRLDF